jgi:hypothetical protein
MHGFAKLLSACAALALTAPSIVGPQQAPDKLRVGTYDTRAIAIAYAPSKFNPVAEKMAEHQKAKAAGDTARVKELEAWGEKFQRQLHRQGFGRVPVDDLLAPVKDKLAVVAANNHLDLITAGYNYSSNRVELVDVTSDLVALFEPSKKTLELVAHSKDQPVLDLDEIEGHKND